MNYIASLLHSEWWIYVLKLTTVTFPKTGIEIVDFVAGAEHMKLGGRPSFEKEEKSSNWSLPLISVIQFHPSENWWKLTVLEAAGSLNLPAALAYFSFTCISILESNTKWNRSNHNSYRQIQMNQMEEGWKNTVEPRYNAVTTITLFCANPVILKGSCV